MFMSCSCHVYVRRWTSNRRLNRFCITPSQARGLEDGEEFRTETVQGGVEGRDADGRFGGRTDLLAARGPQLQRSAILRHGKAMELYSVNLKT
jgi:hypothetical protein